MVEIEKYLPLLTLNERGKEDSDDGLHALCSCLALSCLLLSCVVYVVLCCVVYVMLSCENMIHLG
jgi:hypothetical protein